MNETPTESADQMQNPSSRFEREPRGMFARVAFSVLWFFPYVIVVQMFIGAIVGGFAGGQTDSYEESYKAGQQASIEFFQAYGSIVFLGLLISWLVLSFMGFFPGTGKYKKIKAKK